jgi:hypothetical protein
MPMTPRNPIVAAAVLLLASLAWPRAAGAQPYPPEVQVGARTIADYEFDWGRDGSYCQACNYGAGNNRLAFIDKDGSVWLTHINVDNGYFGTSNGEGTLVDTNAIPAGTTGNGPEWMSLGQASGLVYDRWVDGLPHTFRNGCVGIAHVGAGRQWFGECMSGTRGYALPIGSNVIGDQYPVLSYQNFSRQVTNVYWRLAKDGSEVHEVLDGSNQTGVTRRWIAGTHKLLLTAPAARSDQGIVYRQVFLYSADDGSMQQLTFEPTNKTSAFMWRAPEYGNDFVFFARVGVAEIDVYKRGPDLRTGVQEWQIINRIHPPEAFPYFYSAEPFTYRDRSWLIFSVSDQQQGHHISGSSQIGITGIESGPSTMRLLTSDFPDKRARRDPDYYITQQGPYIYYNRYIVNDDPGPDQPAAHPEGVFRVDSGLGPQSAGNGR